MNNNTTSNHSAV